VSISEQTSVFATSKMLWWAPQSDDRGRERGLGHAPAPFSVFIGQFSENRVPEMPHTSVEGINE
jgi:hypothetical protein